MEESLIIVFLVLGLLFVGGIFIYSIVQDHNFNKMLNQKIDNYEKITIGMKKETAVNLLGDDYTSSILKDRTEKYEWKIKIAGDSWGSSYKGVSVRHHKSGYTVSMTLKFKNGVVVEKKGNNMDLGASSESAIYNYNKVQLDMTVNEVVALLGGGYTVSALQNGTEKYDWKIREEGTSYRSYSHGFSYGSYSGGGTKKITITFKNGRVIEKQGNNLN